MPAYYFWGDDEFSLQKAMQTIAQKVVDPNWVSFNSEQVQGTAAAIDAVIQALNQAMTPPFGMGDRFVALLNPPLTGQDGTLFASELERTLPSLPTTTHLIIAFQGKPDGRSKAVKLLGKHAKSQEFATIPPWKTDQLHKWVQQMAKDQDVHLTSDAIDWLVDAVGNNARQLTNEFEKLRLYRAPTANRPLTPHDLRSLISCSRQSALELASHLRQGDTHQALKVLQDLLNANEPALRLCASLVRQFRTWLWIKLMQEDGERDERAIAQAAEIGNPKRVYFLLQEVRQLSSASLMRSLQLLLELEYLLKQGQDPQLTLQTKVIELCQACQPRSLSASGGR